MADDAEKRQSSTTDENQEPLPTTEDLDSMLSAFDVDPDVDLDALLEPGVARRKERPKPAATPPAQPVTETEEPAADPPAAADSRPASAVEAVDEIEELLENLDESSFDFRPEAIEPDPAPTPPPEDAGVGGMRDHAQIHRSAAFLSADDLENRLRADAKAVDDLIQSETPTLLEPTMEPDDSSSPDTTEGEPDVRTKPLHDNELFQKYRMTEADGDAIEDVDVVVEIEDEEEDAATLGESGFEITTDADDVGIEVDINPEFADDPVDFAIGVEGEGDLDEGQKLDDVQPRMDVEADAPAEAEQAQGAVKVVDEPTGVPTDDIYQQDDLSIIARPEALDPAEFSAQFDEPKDESAAEEGPILVEGSASSEDSAPDGSSEEPSTEIDVDGADDSPMAFGDDDEDASILQDGGDEHDHPSFDDASEDSLDEGESAEAGAPVDSAKEAADLAFEDDVVVTEDELESESLESWASDGEVDLDDITVDEYQASDTALDDDVLAEIGVSDMESLLDDETEAETAPGLNREPDAFDEPMVIDEQPPRSLSEELSPVDPRQPMDYEILELGDPDPEVVMPDDDEGSPLQRLDLPAEPAAGLQDAADPSSLLSPARREELVKLMDYMDKLFLELPEDKIKEFARSEYYDLYEALFQDLGM